MYEGVREIAIEATGFDSAHTLGVVANSVMKIWKQDSVYLSIGGRANLLFKDGTATDAALERTDLSHPLQAAHGENYTEYLDGAVLATQFVPVALAA